MKTINNKDILQGTHYKELETFVNEMCGKFDLKVLDECRVKLSDWYNVKFLPMNYDRFSSRYDKDELENLKNKNLPLGVILTHDGLPNCIVWLQEDDDNVLKYYYHTAIPMREKDDKGFIFSKRLSQLIKKIQTHVVCGRSIEPMSDNNLIARLTRGGSGSYSFYDTFEKLISGNIKSMKDKYNSKDMVGETLHSLMKVLDDDKVFSSTDEYSKYKTKVQEIVEYFDEQTKKIKESESLVQAKLFKPFHLFIQSPNYNSKNNCYALRGNFYVGGDTKEPRLHIFKDSVQYCDSIEDYKDYDSICGRLTMFKNVYPVDETKGELSNLIEQDKYQYNYISGRSDKFDDALDMGYMYFDDSSTNIFYVFE
jgi:hypothetical protein